MIRSAASKVMWVGRATVILVGLAVILALVFGAATALAGTGVGATLNLGRANTVDRVSSLVGSHAGSMLMIDNNGTGTALDLRVGPSTATPTDNNVTPMRVNSQTKVTNLNADEVDGMHASDLETSRGFAHVTLGGAVDTTYPSKGVNGVMTPVDNPAVYCFDLTFTPHAAAGSSHLNNSAVIAAAAPPNSAIAANCPTTHRDAAVKTYASNTGEAAAVNFQVIFE